MKFLFVIVVVSVIMPVLMVLQSTLQSLFTLIASVLGVTPDQAIVLAFGLIMGWVTKVITGGMNKLLGKFPWIGEEFSDKVKGHIMVWVSAAVAVGLVFLGTWVFATVGWIDNPGVLTQLFAALGVNQTVAQWIFERVKSKKDVQAALASGAKFKR